MAHESLFSAQASTMAPAPLQPFTDSPSRSSSRLPSLLMALHHAQLSMVEPGIFDPSSLTQIDPLALRPHPSRSDQPIPFTWDLLVFSLDNPTSQRVPQPQADQDGWSPSSVSPAPNDPGCRHLLFRQLVTLPQFKPFQTALHTATRVILQDASMTMRPSSNTSPPNPYSLALHPPLPPPLSSLGSSIPSAPAHGTWEFPLLRRGSSDCQIRQTWGNAQRTVA